MGRMTSAPFTRNYRDHSNDTGYQFEFFCDKCGNGHRSTYKASATGVGARVLKGLGSLFGGSRMWQAGHAADHMKDAVRGPAWDAAYKEAIDEIRPKFHQCTRCGHWVCPEVCWNEARALCEGCAPDLGEEAAAAQADVAAQQVRQKMHDVDLVGDVDVSQPMMGQCPHCKARVQPGVKFCAECGKPLAGAAATASPTFCSGCGAKLGPGKFCGACGAPATG
jgi:hypothetical protein